MSLAELLLAAGSILLTAQAIYSTALMLYAWEDEDKRVRSRAPRTFEPPLTSFTVLLPARHEEAVIQETIQRVVELDYPRELMEIVVVSDASTDATDDIARSFSGEGVELIRVPRGGKPAGALPFPVRWTAQRGLFIRRAKLTKPSVPTEL